MALMSGSRSRNKMASGLPFQARTGLYAVGKDDGYLIFFCVVLFSGLRASTMEYILAPFAKSSGVTKKKEVTRFSEQAWLLIYYTVIWPLGVVGFSFASLSLSYSGR